MWGCLAGTWAYMGQVVELCGQHEVSRHFTMRVACELGTALLLRGSASSANCRHLLQQRMGTVGGGVGCSQSRKGFSCLCINWKGLTS